MLRAWQESPWQSGELAQYVLVNPVTDIPEWPEDQIVSFVPMEAVEAKTGQIIVQEAQLSTVAQGYTRFREGDLLWAKITPCMQNGKSAVARNLLQDIGFGSTEFHVLRPKDDSVLVDFLWSILSLDSFLDAAQAAFSGSAGQQRVQSDFLASLPIPIPEPDIQRQLVRQLRDALEARRRNVELAKNLLEGFDAYLLEQLGLLAPDEDKREVFAIELGQLRRSSRLNADYFHPERLQAIRKIERPNGYLRSARLMDIADFVRDIDMASLSKRYIGLANVQRNTGELVESTEEDGQGQVFKFIPNDVLFCRLRPYLNKVYCAEQHGVCSTEFHVIRIRPAEKPEDQIFPDYLATVLRSSLVLMQTKHMMTGNTHPRLANEDITNLVIPIPDPITQERIVTELGKRRQQARMLREEAATSWDEARARFEKQLLGQE